MGEVAASETNSPLLAERVQYFPKSELSTAPLSLTMVVSHFEPGSLDRSDWSTAAA